MKNYPLPSLLAALVALILVAIGSVLYLARPPVAEAPSKEPVESHVEIPDDAPDVVPPPYRPAGSEPPTVGETPIIPSETTPVLASDDDEQTVRIRGRAIDATGQGIPGLAIKTSSTSSATSLGTTRDDGTFEFAMRPGDVRLFAVGDDWVTVRSTRARIGDYEREHTIFVAKAVDVAGHVTDDSGAAVAGAHIRIDVPRSAFADLEVPLDLSSGIHLATRSDADGAFALERVPSLPGAILITQEHGFQSDRRAVPEESDDEMMIVLARSEPTIDDQGYSLEGVVIDPLSVPIAGAQIALGSDKATSGDDGRFTLPLTDTRQGNALRCAAAGFQPYEDAEFGQHVLDTAMRPEPIEIRLAGVALAIEGHLVGADGKGREGFDVRLDNPIALSSYRIPVETAEALASDRAAADSTTSSTGAFAIGGLADRDYRLRFTNGDTLEVHVSAPIAAGLDDVRIVLPEQTLHEELHGQVVTFDGEPVAGVRITPKIYLERTETGYSSHGGEPVLTGDNGEFRLSAVPMRESFLTASAREIIPVTVPVPVTRPRGPLMIEVARRAYFRVVHDGNTEAATHVAVEDAAGKRLQISIFEAHGSTTFNVARLETDGSSPVYSVSEEAVTVVLQKSWSEEFMRLPIDLRPGEVVSVHY